MRLTRAAAAAAQIHVDEPTTLESAKDAFSTSQDLADDDRAPLGEVSLNSVDAFQVEASPQGNLLKKSATDADVKHGSDNVGKARFSQNNVDDMMRDLQDFLEEDEENKPAVSDGFSTTPLNEGPSDGNDAVSGVNGTRSELEVPETGLLEKTPEPEDRPIIPIHPRAKQLLSKEKSGMRSTSNKENVEPLTATVAPQEMPESAVTASTGTSETPVSAAPDGQVTKEIHGATEDPIEALDALEEAIEKVDNSLPKIDAIAAAEKTPSGKRKAPTEHVKSASRPSARPSMTSRVSSVRRPAHAKSVAMPKSRTSQIRASDAASKPAPDIPHSKPRPISMSFPTPPPLAKSSRPATTSTFQLPGEAVAAKLKAAREERLNKEQSSTAVGQTTGHSATAEAIKRPAFKARPMPKMSQNQAVVRQTAASRARESLMESARKGSLPAAASTGGFNGTSSLRESMASVRGERPRASMASSRLSMMGSRPSAAPMSLEKKARPTSVIVSKRSSMAPPARLRESISTVAKPAESSSQPREVSNSSTASTGSGPGTKKGKEVFQRAAIEKEALDRQKREKEEAVRKAKVEAAEKQRAASRAWAEKQKAKTIGGKRVSLAVVDGGKDTKTATLSVTVEETGAATAAQ